MLQSSSAGRSLNCWPKISLSLLLRLRLLPSPRRPQPHHFKPRLLHLLLLQKTGSRSCRKSVSAGHNRRRRLAVAPAPRSPGSGCPAGFVESKCPTVAALAKNSGSCFLPLLPVKVFWERGEARVSGCSVGPRRRGMKILCDVCEGAVAAVLCCADEAALCWGCDEKVHAANKLAGKHQRVPLLPTNSNSCSSSSSSSQTPTCDICQEKVGYFFCLEDRALLCRQCDVAVHTATPYLSSHRRFLITGMRVPLQHNYLTKDGNNNNHPLESRDGRFNCQ
ncbi:uncharacterized protein LOC135586931 [Musa acuminata AAA Group]|uniref:uncharacterized protein LOC135586931 n=1 Tax=Musa acuminata AAA Group TaxID=214697 RepID=UPI0031DC5E13